MLDVVLIILTFVSFVLLDRYAVGCERI